ncbi:MAG: response regulator transcription factor [Actinomycetota bacterium]
MGVRVFVVDDTEHVRNMLVEMLQLDGFDVVGQAESGPRAIDEMSESNPDVVVMDYKMPGMNGLATAKAIRAARPEQSIILYTAYLDPVLESLAREAGVAMCVGKVAGLRDLERNISELCWDLGRAG